MVERTSMNYSGDVALMSRPSVSILEPHAEWRRESVADPVREMMVHPHTVFGLADGGAHVGTICDASATTTTLSHWGRDRKNDRLPLGWLVRFLTRGPAEAVGLLDRGLVEVGKKADLVVLDFDALLAERPKIHWDLPAGGRRFLQTARGYRACIVSGEVTYRDGAATGALPGKLIRMGQQERQ